MTGGIILREYPSILECLSVMWNNMVHIMHAERPFQKIKISKVTQISQLDDTSHNKIAWWDFFFFFCRKLQHFLDRPHVCELCLGKRIACAYQRFLFSLAKWLRHNPGITTRVWLTMRATTFVASTVQHANSWFQVPRFPSLGKQTSPTLINIEYINRHIRFWHVCAEVKVAPRKPHKQSPWSSPTWQITFFDFTSFVTCLDGRHARNSSIVSCDYSVCHDSTISQMCFYLLIFAFPLF